MARYIFHLHDGPTTPPREETVEALDDAEARTLGELRLLLSPAYTHVQVRHADREVFRMERDSLKARPR